jgi:putative redox protein
VSSDSTVGVQLTWVEGLQFVGIGERSGGAIVLDGAPEQGGLSHAVRPMEALLLSLAGCTGMYIVSILKKKRQRVAGFRINVLGTRAADYPKQYVRIDLEYVVRGWEIAEEAVVRAIELSHIKYCEVSASLKPEIVTRFRIEQEPVQE